MIHPPLTIKLTLPDQYAAVPSFLEELRSAILMSFLAGLPQDPTKQTPAAPQHVSTAQTLPVLPGALQSEVSEQGVKPLQIAF